jgi:hypothetical protein
MYIFSFRCPSILICWFLAGLSFVLHCSENNGDVIQLGGLNETVFILICLKLICNHW